MFEGLWVLGGVRKVQGFCRMSEHFSLVCLHLHAAVPHTFHDSTNTVYEAVLFVRISGDRHSHAFVDLHPEWLCIHLRGALEVVEVLRPTPLKFSLEFRVWPFGARGFRTSGGISVNSSKGGLFLA